MADYTSIFIANNWSKEQIQKSKLNIAGKFDRDIYERNKAALSIANLRRNLELSEK